MGHNGEVVLQDRFQTVLEQMMPATKKVLLAVSGGADSVALFRLSMQSGLELEVAHLDHQLRTTSAEDAEFVRDLAASYQKTYHLERCSVAQIANAKGWNLEEAARNVRYSFLTRTAKRIGAEYVFTAHTLDDQVETVFMQLLRGAAHLTGMKPLNRQIFRPLLNVSRAEIIVYLEALGQSYRTDQSNFDTRYTRAWLRHELFPVIEKRYSGFKSRLARLAKAQDLERDYMREQAEPFLLQKHMDLAQLMKAHPALQRQVMADLLQKNSIEVSQGRVEDLLTLAQSKTPSRLSLSSSKQARAAYGKLSIVTSVKAPLKSEPVRQASQLPENIQADVITRYPDLVYRSRQAGDFMHLHGGRKKLKELLIDLKVPREERDGLKLLASGKQVFWVEGMLCDPDVAIAKDQADLKFMKLALNEAKRAAKAKELPVGAIMVLEGEIIAQAHNLTEALNDPAAHAEILVIREAAQKLGSWRLSDCSLYVTLEPCPMCFGALLQAHIPRLIYGATNLREGALGSVADLNRLNWKRQLSVTAGILEKPCGQLLRDFFARQRLDQN